MTAPKIEGTHFECTEASNVLRGHAHKLTTVANILLREFLFLALILCVRSMYVRNCFNRCRLPQPQQEQALSLRMPMDLFSAPLATSKQTGVTLFPTDPVLPGKISKRITSNRQRLFRPPRQFPSQESLDFLNARHACTILEAWTDGRREKGREGRVTVRPSGAGKGGTIRWTQRRRLALRKELLLL